MSRGLSSQQRQLLATLVVAKRPLDATRELGPLVGMPATDSGRRSLLRAVRLLAKRGLVTITRDDLAALHGGEAEFSRSAREFRSWAHLRLGCWCAPLPCHGDVLAEAAEAAAMR